MKIKQSPLSFPHRIYFCLAFALVIYIHVAIAQSDGLICNTDESYQLITRTRRIVIISLSARSVIDNYDYFRGRGSNDLITQYWRKGTDFFYYFIFFLICAFLYIFLIDSRNNRETLPLRLNIILTYWIGNHDFVICNEWKNYWQLILSSIFLVFLQQLCRYFSNALNIRWAVTNFDERLFRKHLVQVFKHQPKM